MRRRAVWTAARAGGLSGAIVGMLIASSYFLDAVSDQPMLLAVFIVGLGLIGFCGHNGFVKRGLEGAIARSNKRMQDAQYRSTLTALGILAERVGFRDLLLRSSSDSCCHGRILLDSATWQGRRLALFSRPVAVVF